MGKKIFCIFALCWVALLSWGFDVQALRVTDEFDVGGYLQNETAFSTSETGDILWCENKALFYGTYNFNPNFRAFFRVQGYYDAINSLQPSNYRDISGDRYMDRETYFRENLWQPKSYTSSEYLKELFIDFTLPAFDLRIGKQQFAWGVTDGIKVLDIVYPQDFRKFNQDAFEESRIPLWSVKFDYYVGTDSEIQLVYLPKFEPAFHPGGGHPFAVWGNEFFDVLNDTGVSVPLGPPPIPLWDVNFNVNYDAPAATFDNGEYGVMWRDNQGDFSYSLNFMSHYTDTAGAYQTGMTTANVPIGPNEGGGNNFLVLPTDIELTLKNQRVYSFGGSFDATLSDLPLVESMIFRFEAIYNHDNIMVNVPDKLDIVQSDPFGNQYFISNYLPVPVTGPNGSVVWAAGVPFPETVSVDDWMYALGFDKYIFTDLFLSFQFIHHHVMGYKSSFINAVSGKQAERNDYWGTFLVQKDWLNEKLWTKVLNVVGRHGDFWIQPEVSYLFQNTWKLTVQGNFYGGAPGNMFSRFSSADNVVLRMTYQF